MLVFYLAAIDSDENKNKFEYIYHKYYRFMLRTASSIIRDSALAEDAVHETLEYCGSDGAALLRYLFKSIYSVFSFRLIFTGIFGIRSFGGSTLRRR